MIRVTIKELEGLTQATFDIYNESGRLVLPKGSSLSPGKILQLSYFKIYRKDEPVSIDNSNVSAVNKAEKDKQDSDDTNITSEIETNSKKVVEEIPETPKEFDSKISEKVRVSILTSTRTFLNDVFNGKTPDLAVCELASENLVKEVTTKIDEVQYLGQLRVFDEYTYSHNVNVSALSVALAIKIGLSEQEIKDLALAALLHDIGKMRIPKEVLNKPGRLTDKEFEIMKLHAPLGYKVIKDELNLPFHISRVALEHQERFSGGGYPKGILGDQMSTFSQICSIADVYDALVSKRVYKPAKTSQEAIKIMLSEGSKSFNPAFLYKFTHMTSYNQLPSS